MDDLIQQDTSRLKWFEKSNEWLVNRRAGSDACGGPQSYICKAFRRVTNALDVGVKAVLR